MMVLILLIRSVLPNGVYQVKTMNGKMLKQKQNGCNLKKFHVRQEDEVKKKDTDETEIQIGMQMGRKVDGKMMNLNRRHLDRKMKHTRGMIMKQKLKLASNWMEHRMTVVSRGFQMNRKVNADKVMIKLTKRMLSLCVNSLLHGIGIVLQHLLGENKSENSSYCQLPILTLNVARKEH